MKRLLTLLLMTILLCGCSSNSNITTVDVDKLAEETPSKITIDVDPISEGETSSKATIDVDSISDGETSSKATTDVDPISKDSSTNNPIKENSNSGEGTESGSIAVNADVTIPSQSSYGIYGVSFAKMSESDAFKIKNILWEGIAEKYDDVEYEVVKSRYGENYIWSNKSIRLGIGSYNSRISMNSEFSGFILNVFYPPTVNSATNVKSFEQCDLDFCTRKDAIEAVLEILEQIDVKVYDDPDVYSLNQRDLKNAANETLKKYPSIKDSGTFPTTIDSKYECYYIRFNAQYNGVPIYNQMINFKTIPDYFINNPEIEAIYSSEGLKYLQISNYPYQINLEKEVTELISAEDAARIAVDKYKDVKTSSSISIDKVDLMYVYTPTVKSDITSGEYSAMMTPSWVCSGTLRYNTVNSDDADKIELKNDIIIDAVTGKEII